MTLSAARLCLVLALSATVQTDTVSVVNAIRRADYEGDRAALLRLETDLAARRVAPADAARVHYWRGFARWRRAINAFNDAPDPVEIRADLEAATRQFEAAIARDPGFIDATAALISTIGYRMFLGRDDPQAIQALADQYRPMAAAAMKAAPDHPRLLWVLGPSRWSAATRGPAADAPAQQDATIASYERALATLRSRSPAQAGPLDPDWGEPELLMSLAWSHLNKTEPDPVRAEKYARDALALVPHWHYVRDILLPQVLAAKGRR
jgi:hypothetical protein